MKNREIAKELNEIAEIMEIQEIQWKPRAYRSAARKIENLSEDLEDIYKQQGKKGLEKIPSIGKKLSQHIADLIDQGRVKKWDKLRKKSVPGLHELLHIEGLGSKKVKKLFSELNIKNIDDLQQAAQNNQIRELSGFGRKSEQNILKSINRYKKSNKRMLLAQAWTLAGEIINFLQDNAEIIKIDAAGSLRRMKETVGDIDILSVSSKPEELMETLANIPNKQRILVQGKTKTSLLLKEGFQVDFRCIDQESYGAALVYFTGSKSHNIELRKIASDKGYKLSEYGLFRKKSDKLVAGGSEKEIYQKLGLNWIPPELRENRGELEKFRKNNFPDLIELKHIRGDLQMHTKYSDGHNSIREMAKKAAELGYDYICITDHSKSERIAKGMKESEIKKQWEEIEKINKKEQVKILKGAEVNILDDGTLDYEDELLKKLDVVLIAVHSGFKSSKTKMTKRILKALDNKYVNILAHPTGRKIFQREGYNADFEEIFKKCKQKKVAVEINCDPIRLDLNDRMIIRAKQIQVKFSLGTDSHTQSSLENIKYGIGQARRGWLEKNDVINTLTYKQLIKFLKK